MAKLEYIKIGGKVFSRPKVVIPRKNIGECAFCDIPVYASSGQLIKWLGDRPTHKSCRKGKLRNML